MELYDKMTAMFARNDSKIVTFFFFFFFFGLTELLIVWAQKGMTE
jgi:hypothetical protein